MGYAVIQRTRDDQAPHTFRCTYNARGDSRRVIGAGLFLQEKRPDTISETVSDRFIQAPDLIEEQR
jgi:hypothetical protein